MGQGEEHFDLAVERSHDRRRGQTEGLRHLQHRRRPVTGGSLRPGRIFGAQLIFGTQLGKACLERARQHGDRAILLPTALDQLREQRIRRVPRLGLRDHPTVQFGGLFHLRLHPLDSNPHGVIVDICAPDRSNDGPP